MRFPILVTLGFLGCNGAPLESATVEHDARFVGQWIVDQPAHAGYEASLYQFGADGSLELVRAFAFDGPAPAEPTGTVGKDALSCAFGAGWHSKGSQVLVIDGECGDGRAREI